MTLRGSAPTKLYRPIVSVVAALSNRKESLDLDLPRRSVLGAVGQNESRTHFAETFRYMLDGVRNSAEMEEKTGTRLGGFGELTAAANTSRTVSMDG